MSLASLHDFRREILSDPDAVQRLKGLSDADAFAAEASAIAREKGYSIAPAAIRRTFAGGTVTIAGGTVAMPDDHATRDHGTPPATMARSRVA